MTVFRHLPWRVRVAWLWYPLRGLVVAPAPTMERCIVGSTIHPRVWCPRRSVDVGEWPTRLCCERHQ